jgi:hypothetical protein
MPEKTISQIIKGKSIISENLEVLPISFPYKIISKIGIYNELPSDKKYRVKVTIPGDGFFIEDTVCEIFLSDLTDKSFTLSYLPASSSDAAVIQSYGGLYNTPAYLVKLKPCFKVDGIEKIIGPPVGFGDKQKLIIEIIMPNQSLERIENNIIAGEFYAICVTWPSIGIGMDAPIIQKLKTYFLTIGTDFIQNGYLSEELCGNFFALQGKTYYAQIGLVKEMAASLLHVSIFQDINEATVSIQLNVDYLFGMPSNVNPLGLMIDADRNISLVVPKSGEEWKIKEYMILTGYSSSAFEHLIWEKLYGPGGVSAVKVIQIANEKGVPVYDIDKSNESVIDTLGISAEVKSDMHNAINMGYVIKTPAQNITYSDWTGIGYVLLNPLTGEGKYIITSGNGGAIAWSIAGIVGLFLYLRNYKIQEKAIQKAKELVPFIEGKTISECEAFAEFAQYLADQFSELEFYLSFFLSSLYDLSVSNGNYYWVFGLLGPLGPRAERPLWLNKHDDGDWGSGYKIFYYYDVDIDGSTDVTGRKDHFVSNAILSFVGYLIELYLVETKVEVSENDLTYNSLGREFGWGITMGKISKNSIKT